MSIYVVLGILFLIYVLPELLRSKKKQYEYPEVPDLEPVQTPPPFTYEYGGEGVSMEHSGLAETGQAEWQAKSYKPQVTMPAEVAVPIVVSDTDPWADRLSSHDITNGVIFAEILQPPRSKRPLQCWRKR